MFKIILIYILIYLIRFTCQEKITLFDSTKFKDDLNWMRLSYISNSTINKNKLINEQYNIINKNDDIYGWKESSFSLINGDDVWRIYFVCDLNVKNIQNWLFTPLISTREANRLILNLTYTIRECEQFPINQVFKTCREKFELYYEELDDDEYFINKNQYSSLITSTDYDNQNNNNIDSSIYLLNKLNKLKFHDTFVSDSSFKYLNTKQRKTSTSTSGETQNGELINIELRDVTLNSNKTYIRFGIRDTGSCISLLALSVNFLTCPKLTKYGITFPKTSTGHDLTDLIQVSGTCPLYSTNFQIPKALCTAKGEWLITDQSLSNRCLCLPGYEFIDDNCLPCQPGTYKRSPGNENRCLNCPSNSWSYNQAAEKCDCLRNFFRNDEFNASSECREMEEINANNIDIIYLNEYNNVNISINNKNNKNYQIICNSCQQNENINLFDGCINNCSFDVNTGIVDQSSSVIVKNNKKRKKFKIQVFETLNEKISSNSSIYVSFNNLNNHEASSSSIQLKNSSCEIVSNENNFDNNKDSVCYNLTINFNTMNLFQLRELYNNYKLKVYLLQLNDFFKKYSLIKTFTSMNRDSQNDEVLKFTLKICNQNENLVQLQLKFQLEFIQAKKIFVNFFDMNLNDACNPKGDNFMTNKNSKNKILNVISFKSTKSTKTDELVNTTIAISNQPSNSTSNMKINVLLPILLSCLFVACIVVLIVFLKRLQKRKIKEADNMNCNNKFSKLFPTVNRNCSCASTHCSTSSTSESSSTTHSTTITQMLSQNSKLYYVEQGLAPHTYEDPGLAVQQFANEIDPNDIKIESVIGGGEFGDVCKGKLKLNNNDSWIPVAIKTLKVGSSDKNRCDFLTEASIMAQFHHENIIFLEGVVTKSHPYMIITEYMDNGSLDTFLRLNSWRLNIHDLIKILKDIANGMKYLSEMNFVHRDLAARNILINKTMTCKVADFGLSRELENDDVDGAYWTKGGKIPVRWTAPEAISYRKFTPASDVWSYGVLAWEVMSFAERPYWNWSNQDVVKCIEKGYRLPLPANCPNILYDLMLRCWNIDRLVRPKFKEIVNDLEINQIKKENLYKTTKQLSSQVAYNDTNKPNIAQLTSIDDWLISLNLTQYLKLFKSNQFLNLSQILDFQYNDLNSIGIWDESHKRQMMESFKTVQFDISFKNGFLV